MPPFGLQGPPMTLRRRISYHCLDGPHDHQPSYLTSSSFPSPSFPWLWVPRASLLFLSPVRLILHSRLFIHAIPTAWYPLPTTLQTACFFTSLQCHHLRQALRQVSKIAISSPPQLLSKLFVSFFFMSFIITRNSIIYLHDFGL